MYKPDGARALLENLAVTEASRQCIEMSHAMIRNLTEQKETMKRLIIEMGTSFEREIKLLITIKGVTPLLALAFLADVGDIKRFKNARGFNAYLGIVPTVKSSGCKTYLGHIFIKDIMLAPKMFFKGKLGIIPHTIKETKGMKRIFKKTFGKKEKFQKPLDLLQNALLCVHKCDFAFFREKLNFLSGAKF